MKKILTLLLAAAAAVSTAFAFTACDLFGSNDGDNGNSEAVGDGNTGAGNGDSNGGGSTDGGTDKEEHTHSYVWKVENPTETKEGKSTGTCSCGDTQIKTFPNLTDSRYIKENDTATCTEKGKAEYTIRIDGTKYVFNVETPATGVHDYKSGVCVNCNVADPNYVPHKHTYEDKADTAGHWTECSCGDKTAVIAHSYSYAKDATHHWQVCSVKSETTDKVLHTYNNGVCVCGAPAPHVHSFTSVKYDAAGHWTECACGDKTEAVPHAYTDGKCSCGAEKPANELDYKLTEDGNAYAVVGIGTVTDKHVIIPAKYNGLPVTEIGAEAFKDCDMTEITVPSSMKKIGFSFHGCTELKKVNYTGTVSGWASIRMHTSSVGHILSNARSLYIDGKHVTEVVVDNIDYFGNGFEGSDIVSVKVGSGVKELHGYAFENCTNLVSAEIGNGVKIELFGSPFRFCTKLENVKLPADLKIIPQSMFEGCAELKQISLPKGLTHIDDMAFRDSGLTSITIPASVQRIGAFAFEYCYDLQSVRFEDPSDFHVMPWAFIHKGMTPEDNNRKYIVHLLGYYNEFDDDLEAALLKNPDKDFTEGKFGLSLTIVNDENEETACTVGSGNGYAIYAVIDGEKVPLAVGCSIIKGDTSDSNACSWTTGNMVPARR